ncbi:unnamed protein product [Medioppia subpectinata]|uniref:Uncharacterized protein n=1 Tax=Medioppia subpectinata TaxID=1979941 RepID=A0A7R9L5J1_9ACAR|nr:unnamed protein product [Medioppia subpectinata]CAG2115917.1 unnamed protein product [Medioppia subpectinata]
MDLSRSQLYSFTICHNNEPVIHLADNSETESQFSPNRLSVTSMRLLLMTRPPIEVGFWALMDICNCLPLI